MAMDDTLSAAGQGRLAQVIAARGGQAAPEAPFVIEHREALIYMLCQAAELEHIIMCQYLFAAFSLKQRLDEGLTEAEQAAVARWRRQISQVATQEMLHLALVQNLLSAIGGAPHLARPNLPQPANHYPAGVQLAWLPFGEQALRHFMFLERPEGMDLDDAAGLTAVGRATPLMQEGDIVPRLQDFATVGHLYRSIEEGIEHLAAKFGERWLFVGPSRAQATTAAFTWPELVTVTDVASARRAIEEILEQGEGPRGHWQDAHFGQFVQILDEFQQMKEANPAFDPVRPVLVANVRPCEHASDVLLITDPITARCTDLFNVGYEILLLALERYFAHTEETDAQLATLADLTLGLMLRVVKPLGELITTMPAGPDYPGKTAGPSFELFYESDYLMPHREAAWILLAERLREAAEFCERIRADADTPVAEALAPVGPALAGMADSLATHIPDRGGTATSATVPDHTNTSAGGWGALLDRATELTRQVVGGVVVTDETTRGIAELVTESRGVLAAMAEAAGSRPGRLDQAAGRLVDSVLQPLARSLRSASTDAAPHLALEIGAGNGSASVDEQVWALATAATRLRADRHGPPELLEATAALQDLAVMLTPPEHGGERDGRLAELRTIQAGLPAEIQSAPDGPYLVTNVEHMVDWLGRPIPTRPQMALCRCGGSAIKPFCDGTHARIGFTTDKDPKRVPDRRETYLGQQVTILDNRGICAHSGFCTDRLASVFHLGQEPFVTPSGARMDDVVRAVRDCPSGALSYAIGAHEAREQVDQDRDPTIEVSRDGPYRITGGIVLRNIDDVAEAPGDGSSREHYSLCRCGRSQNKPFCSGMHWYVDFHDPPFPPADREPTLFEWAGGYPALLRMTRILYSKYVAGDPLLGPLFADMSPDQPERVATWLGQVFGGPPAFTESYGGYPQMVSQHIGTGITEAHRSRWVSMMCQAADEAGLPADAEFRAAFVAYLEWESRLAVERSTTGAHPPPDTPVPTWGWVGNATPDARYSVPAPQPEADEPIELPAEGEAVSFRAHIKPLFRRRDRQSMSFAFDLWAHADVAAHATDILARLADGSMPCDGAWPPEKMAVFRRWVESDAPE
jgi:CDGSH-type Zn-finger protein/truncated hemoglobin YjbI